jgi:hypothetical protein
MITVMLPFHEINAEISARTSPTVLDLITAGFCAIAGVYASLRPGSETATTAAGTSIGISLVPPLCASGIGFGTSMWSVAGGAALLFLTNLVAIVVVGTMAFVASGFNRVEISVIEHEELSGQGTDAPIARALAMRLSRLFDSRWGSTFRFLMPFALLGAVYLPLRRALDEVAWEVRTRAAIRVSLSKVKSRIVQSRVHVERHGVEVVVVLLGKTTDADSTRKLMTAEIREVSGVTPRIEVLAVPDAGAFAGLESTLFKPHPLVTQSVTPLPTPNEQLTATQGRVRASIEELWATNAAGKPLAIDLGADATGSLRIRVVHLGAPISKDGTEILRLALKSRLGRDVQLIDVSIPSGKLTRHGGDLAFVEKLTTGIRAITGIPEVNVCVGRPVSRGRDQRTLPADSNLARILEELLASHPQATITTEDEWSVRFVQGTCVSSTTGSTDVVKSNRAMHTD